MKKSLKALILCGLASLVMFAVVYASPITAQAATHQGNGSVYLENTNNVIGSFTFTYDDSEVTYNDCAGVAGYWLDTSYVGVYVEVNAQPVANGTPSVIPVSYDFVFAGSHFTGSVDLTYSDGEHKYTFTGAINYVEDEATGYGKEINDLENKIGNISNDSTLTGKNRVIEFNEGTALPGNIIGAMANSQNVTLKFTFVYNGFEFCTTITGEDAKRLNNPAIKWWGPCYLAENFPTVWTGKTVK